MSRGLHQTSTADLPNFLRFQIRPLQPQHAWMDFLRPALFETEKIRRHQPNCWYHAQQDFQNHQKGFYPKLLKLTTKFHSHHWANACNWAQVHKLQRWTAVPIHNDAEYSQISTLRQVFIHCLNRKPKKTRTSLLFKFSRPKKEYQLSESNGGKCPGDSLLRR